MVCYSKKQNFVNTRKKKSSNGAFENCYYCVENTIRLAIQQTLLTHGSELCIKYSIMFGYAGG